MAFKISANNHALREIFDVEPYFLESNSRNRWRKLIYRHIIMQLWTAWQITLKPGSIIYYRYAPKLILLNWLFLLLGKRNYLFVEINTKHEDEFKTNKILKLSNKLSEKAVFRGATCILTITQELANYAHRLIPGCATRVMGNGYEFPDKPIQLGLSTNGDLAEVIAQGRGKRKFIWVGEPALWHGLDRIIAIISQLEDSCLFLVGDPTQLSNLELMNLTVFFSWAVGIYKNCNTYMPIVILLWDASLWIGKT